MKGLPFDVYDFFGYIAAGIVVLVTAQLGWGFPILLGRTLSVFDTTAATLAAYIAGQIVAGPSGSLLEDLFARRLLGTPVKILLGQNSCHPLRFLFPAYFTPLPPKVIGRIEKMIAPLKLTSESEEIFTRIRFSGPVLANEALLAKLNTFLYKYGFCRNVAFSLLCASAAFFLRNRFAGNQHLDLARYALAALVAGFLLIYRYLFFYRLYSYELMNQFAGHE